MKFRNIVKGLLAVIVILITIALVILFILIPPKALYANFESSNDQGAHPLLKIIAGDLTVDTDYKNLPEVLVMASGEEVRTIDQLDIRQDEMMNFFYDEVYGRVPDIDYEVEFDLMDERDCYDGKGIVRQVEMTIATRYGENKSILLMYLPKQSQEVPIFVGLNFRGNTLVDGDPQIITSYGNIFSEDEIEDSRGERNERWQVEMLLDNGYGLITACANDFAPDDSKNYDRRLIQIFGGDTEESEFKAIGAWAFGLSRMVDYVSSLDIIDEDAIISFGHSRMGKTSLWAGAQDERIDLVISNGSGNTGAALSRNTSGETNRFINFAFPHWFLDGYGDYNGKIDEMAWDQHMLLASIAPRKVYIASSDRDLWAFPQGEYDALRFAEPVYKLYGSEPILLKTLPETASVIHTDYFGYHIKDDRHKITEVDWQHFIDYADMYLSH